MQDQYNQNETEEYVMQYAITGVIVLFIFLLLLADFGGKKRAELKISNKKGRKTIFQVTSECIGKNTLREKLLQIIKRKM